MRILLVEDDPDLSRQLKAALADAGYAVDHAPDGEEAHFLGDTEPYDAVILDLGLPKIDGVSVLERWRREGRGTPVLILTARGSWSDKVAGFDAGADDYLTKPFSFDEFVARIEALLRRSDLQGHESELRVGDLSLDPTTRRVSRGARAIELTPKEYALLRYLMENAGTVLSRTQILNNNWGYGFDPGTKVVDVYIRYLRKKVDEGEDVPLIHTIRGAGYCIGDRH